MSLCESLWNFLFTQTITAIFHGRTWLWWLSSNIQVQEILSDFAESLSEFNGRRQEIIFLLHAVLTSAATDV